MILFFCTASSTHGMGHLMRCRSLAMGCKERALSCGMIGPSLSWQNKNDRDLFDIWIARSSWRGDREEADSLCALAVQYGASFLVIDDYTPGEEFQKIVHNFSLPWLQFDYSGNVSLWGDYIVNASLGAHDLPYRAVIQNPAAKLFLGPDFALLRPEFRCTDVQKKGQNILVSFGGGDDRGAVLFVVQALLPVLSGEEQIYILSGAQNPRNTEIQRWISHNGRGRVEFFCNPPYVANLFTACRMAVLAGGTTTYEAACCKLPMILVSIAENQVRQARAWHNSGGARYLGSFPNVTKEAVQNAYMQLSQSSSYVDRICSALSCVDGGGAQRLAKIIDERSHDVHKPLTSRRVDNRTTSYASHDRA
ncbi:PseG/SpsG family protein [Chitinivibrio alkaliphilus]|uniref:Pseudaminic acid biosynthesis-associated protein PseG n=1 Tax=Chitinivibrio alkaliphilus ACht1 TaxID=1313304 RepID=U7DCL1_9BACT|nr:pseudaminic acid biosynthesis-associated protein PseG [Chitinivibrio alkaliphilus]ERP39283.1 pseudaminic acid biosynthesis-associated protein PseG [Chitinivibrio alkaliphilus ACht1]